MKALCTPPETVAVYSESTFGCSGDERSRNTIPFFREEACWRVITPILPSGVVETSLIRRASTISESTFRGFAGSEMSKV